MVSTSDMRTICQILGTQASGLHWLTGISTRPTMSRSRWHVKELQRQAVNKGIGERVVGRLYSLPRARDTCDNKGSIEASIYLLFLVPARPGHSHIHTFTHTHTCTQKISGQVCGEGQCIGLRWASALAYAEVMHAVVCAGGGRVL